MSYLYGGIAALILGVLAYLYKLIRDNKSLVELVESQKAKDLIAGIEQKLKEQNVKVSEAELDYENAKKEFDAKYGNSDDGSGKPS